MIDPKSYQFFRNFANSLRVAIINELITRDMYVNEISETLQVEQSKVSHALAHLKRNGIVTSACMGKNRIYSVNKKIVLPMLKIAKKHSIHYNDTDQEC